MRNLDSTYHDLLLNVGRILPQSKVNGPGTRFVIWLQGCRLRCPGCVNHELWPHEPKQLLSVRQLYEQIVAIPDVEGVTYSGGEPFEQAEGLDALSLMLKEAGLGVLSYSGYTYEELAASSDRHISGLLLALDILIDGPFEREQAAPLLWRGSRNQQVRFFTERYAEYASQIDNEEVEMEFVLNEGGLGVTGNFDEKLLQKIAEKLQQDYGVIFTSENRRGDK